MKSSQPAWRRLRAAFAAAVRFSTPSFGGGPSNPQSSLTHPLAYTLSGWFGGYSSQDDHAVLSVSFGDAANYQIEFNDTPIIDAAARGGITSLLSVSSSLQKSVNVNLAPAGALTLGALVR